MFPLKKGSNGAEVKILQLYLQDKYKADFPLPQGANGNFGNKTAEYVKQYLGVDEVSEEMYRNLVVGNARGKVLTDAEKQVRRENVSRYVDTGANLLGQVLGYKTAREQAKTAATNAQNPNFQPYIPPPPPPPPPSSGMPTGLKVVLGVLLLGIVVAIVVALSKKKNATTEA